MTEKAKLCFSLETPFIGAAERTWCAAVVLSVVLAAACRGPDRPAEPRRVAASYAPDGTLQRLDYDANGNGRPDVRTFMDGSRAVRSEIDADEDGVTDRWEYYDDQRQLVRVGTSSAGDGTVDTWHYPESGASPARIERSSGRDGRIDRREYLEGDEVVRAEEDTDRDGRVDRWETYTHGVLTALGLDTRRTLGRPDRRLVYGPGGDLLRLEVDPDGDGVFETVPPGPGF